ncbi:MAG: hypothetical protein COW30_17310 [Rhodospirillales bacterium CG15_BIG_FIL_POST_REV_8_21_14_020_66_15]|nr:MAG: hypothetical protein COW30_17310 [Rhodospirillales bacterium CG15_BIG_FIL_POST_REV_8_21_14_020_66_15]
MGAEHQPVSYLDLYSKSLSPDTPLSSTGSPSRELIPLSPVLPPDAGETEGAVKDTAPTPTLFGGLTGGLSLRGLTPRQMADVSLDLYAAGVLAFEDYELLAFQPELHPDYNDTIGALTGEPAGPDRARDYVSLWEERLNFERRHNPQNTRLVRRTERILNLLLTLDGPPDGSGRPLAA